MKTKQPAFKRGDTVTWESQASGFKKKKTGSVVGVISAGRLPYFKYGKASFAKSAYERIVNGVTERVNRSYVVNVNGKLYWPLVKYLKHKA